MPMFPGVTAPTMHRGGVRAPEFSRGAGKTVHVGDKKGVELPLGAQAKRLDAQLGKESETGDGPALVGYRLSPQDLAAARSSPDRLKTLLFDTITGADQAMRPDFRPADFEATPVSPAEAAKTLRLMYEGDGATPGPAHRKLEATLRELLPLLQGGSGTTLYRAVWHDVGDGSYSGLVALDQRTGEIRAALNSLAP